MIKRIVRMQFREEATGKFMEIFSESSPQIRAFDGCRYLELVRDVRDPNVFFTVSHWDSAERLEAYRTSRLFKTTWTETKALFSGRPEAWSTESITKLP